MIEKLIAFLFRTVSSLEKLDEKAKAEYQKYANKQVKKAVTVAGSLGLGLGLVLALLLF